MDDKTYVKRVIETESISFEKIRQRISKAGRIRLLHSAMGICTEAGEYMDTLKKFFFYGEELDVKNLIAELGDLMWYIGIACDELNIDLSEVKRLNIEKLEKRYGKKFSEEKAKDRDLENEQLTFEELENKVKERNFNFYYEDITTPKGIKYVGSCDVSEEGDEAATIRTFVEKKDDGTFITKSFMEEIEEEDDE